MKLLLGFFLFNWTIIPEITAGPRRSQKQESLGTAGARHFCKLDALPVTDVVWFGLLVFNGTFGINRLCRAIGVSNTLCRAGVGAGTLSPRGQCGLEAKFCGLGLVKPWPRSHVSWPGDLNKFYLIQ